MSLSIIDARILSKAIKEARKRKHLTQATCAELLGISLSFQKDLERCRCSPSIEVFYHICRTLNISADACIFPTDNESNQNYQQLIRMLSLCDSDQLSILIATASAILNIPAGDL